MNKTTLAGLVALAAVAAACSDNAAAPRTQASVPTTSTVSGGGATGALSMYDTTRFSIVINPQFNSSFVLGDGNTLVVPSHTLCDPAVSTYGPDQWDTPCVTDGPNVTVNVKEWLDGLGHAHIDFDQHIRFMPNPNNDKWVYIAFTDVSASNDPYANILYCATPTSVCVDESLTDPSVLTIRNPNNGKVTRRVKHFSGYNVAAGDDESSYNRRAGGRTLSVSTSDLKLNDLMAVSRAHPSFSDAETKQMLENIEDARAFSGYILASGQTGDDM